MKAFKYQKRVYTHSNGSFYSDENEILAYNILLGNDDINNYENFDSINYPDLFSLKDRRKQFMERDIFIRNNYGIENRLYSDFSQRLKFLIDKNFKNEIIDLYKSYINEKFQINLQEKYKEIITFRTPKCNMDILYEKQKKFDEYLLDNLN